MCIEKRTRGLFLHGDAVVKAVKALSLKMCHFGFACARMFPCAVKKQFDFSFKNH